MIDYEKRHMEKDSCFNTKTENFMERRKEETTNKMTRYTREKKK